MATCNLWHHLPPREWSRLLPLPHPLHQAAPVAFLVFSRNVPSCHLSVSSPGLSCLPASLPSTLKPQPSSAPPCPPSQVGHNLMSQRTPKPSVACCLLIQLHFPTQPMLLRSRRTHSVLPARYSRLSPMASHPRPSAGGSSSPFRPSRHRCCFTGGHITIQCPGRHKEHGTLNPLLSE